MKKKIYHMHADICKALAHAIRIEIIDVLGKKELQFSEILEQTNLPKSSLSQHLSVMVEKGILIQRRQGLNTYFKIFSPKVAKACQLMREVLFDRLEKNRELLNYF
jgi:DNA-binding transcriptional ArsR family regulator